MSMTKLECIVGSAAGIDRERLDEPRGECRAASSECRHQIADRLRGSHSSRQNPHISHQFVQVSAGRALPFSFVLPSDRPDILVDCSRISVRCVDASLRFVH
ncbi:hypothetical protein WR25_22059 [Diploscapter pachys]|uniref:Uncharacterized protein n=1 Tax=Diploscapter pachys TaxID=2018661 RepID=A0A2A2LEB9_9BILA|nr:hypothetical protein WR25_22059 [Diploscapter pachys]